MASSLITSWQIDGETMETMADFYLGLQNHCRWWLQPEIKRCLLFGRKIMTNLDRIFKSRDITLPAKVRLISVQFGSVTQSCSTLCDPMNHSTPGLPVLHHLLEFTDSCPSTPWCHPAISFSVVPFSSCPQSLPASESFPVSQFFASGGQSIGVSVSASGPSNAYSGLISFRMDWLDLLAVQGTLKSLIPQFKSISSSVLSFPYSPTLTSIHDHWKNHSLE